MINQNNKVRLQHKDDSIIKTSCKVFLLNEILMESVPTGSN